MKSTEFGKVTRNYAITPFKVIDFSTNRKLMRLPISDYYSVILSAPFQVMVNY